jgi:hypothetical protein
MKLAPGGARKVTSAATPAGSRIWPHAPGELAAQVTRMPMGPMRSSVAALQRVTSRVTLLSPVSASTRRPVADWNSLAGSPSGPGVRALMATPVPSVTGCSATYRPIPLLAPVTGVTFPSS